MRRVIPILLVFISCQLLAQSSNISTLFLNSFEKAERMYQALAYRNALELYLYTVERHPDNNEARQRIAECYFRLGNIEEAEKRYAELANMAQANPIYKYQYAQVLSIQGKYGEAERWFAEYAKAQTDDPRAAAKLDFIYSLSYYFRDSVLYTISNEPYNSNQSDFSPHFYKDQIVFVSARDRDLFIKKKSLSAIDEDEAHLNVFVAPKAAIESEKDIEPFYGTALNSPLHDGPIVFFDNQKQVAFTRSNMRNGKPYVNKQGRINFKIFFARLGDDNKLSRLTEFPFNDDEYSNGHPWVNEDGTIMYYASDMPGGVGGVDLYRSELQNGKWSKPVNLGSKVNTLGDDLYPYVANDSALYYSSNGLGGLGGLDIFVSYNGKDDQFRLPSNLGYPLNTSSDDFALILDSSGRGGLFSSNRPGGVGYDDIYKFKVKSFFLTGKVVDRFDSTAVIPEAEVSLFNSEGSKVGSAISNDHGIVHFDLAFDEDYNISAAKEEYSWVDTLAYSTFTRYMGGDSVLIPLWKQSLFAKGKVYSNETQSILPGASVRIDNLTDGTTETVVLDSLGEYTFKLEPNKKYKISSFKVGHLDKSFTLNTKDIFRGILLNDILLEEIFEEKTVIQFDFDKSELRPDGIALLKPLLRTLNRKKKTTLNIGAHADAYGTKQYNQRLSERRAKAVLDYFVSNGIARSRIVARGFGEELLLNNCSEGTDCTEEENSLNRRAEMKVQMPE